MTASQSIVPVSTAGVRLSANDLFKSRYNRYLRWSVLAALLLTAVGVWLMPSYEPTPYVRRETVIEIIPIEVIPDVVEPEKPQVRERPDIPEIQPTADPIDEPFELPPNFGGKFWTPSPIDPAIQGDEGFLPSSSKPRLIAQPKPDYPELMRAVGIEGVVIVQVLVGPDGLVKATQVTRSVHPTLDRAAVAAASLCRFEPGLQRSVPVQAWVEVPYRFRLH